MPSPFPGMDPYLEGPNIWPDVHAGLITATRDALAPQVAPAYYVAIEQRTYIVAVEEKPVLRRPDVAIVPTGSETPPAGGGGTATLVAMEPLTVALPLFDEMREGYLEVRDVQTHAVVTAIEVLSPTNKLPGDGREEYERKRREVLMTETSLVEIDLVRMGQPMAMTPLPTTEYRILVCPGWAHLSARLYAFGLHHLLPDVPVPLRRGEVEAVLPLGKLLADLYDRARYDLRIDYQRTPPEPPLSTEDAVWIEELLLAQGRRG